MLGTPKLHYINRLGIKCWKWNVIIYINNCFRVNHVIIICQWCTPLYPTWLQTHIFQRAICSNYRYRIVLQEEVNFITETDLWECWQKISHFRSSSRLNSLQFPPWIQILGAKRIHSVRISATMYSHRQSPTPSDSVLENALPLARHLLPKPTASAK